MRKLYSFTDRQKKLIITKLTEFYNLVQQNSTNGIFDSFQNNSFLNSYENYKYRTIKRTRPIIEKIKDSKIFGKGIVRELLIDAINEGYNLVNSFWRNNVRGVLDDLRGAKLTKFEKNLHDLYSGKMTDEAFFDYYTSEVSKIYNIIAYILFLKNSKKYLPLATTTFDQFFKEVEIDFHTTSNCSWENYS